MEPISNAHVGAGRRRRDRVLRLRSTRRAVGHRDGGPDKPDLGEPGVRLREYGRNRPRRSAGGAHPTSGVPPDARRMVDPAPASATLSR